jgi:hypothetical protein
MVGIAGTEPEQVVLDHISANLHKAFLNFALELNGQQAKVGRQDSRSTYEPEARQSSTGIICASPSLPSRFILDFFAALHN